MKQKKILDLHSGVLPAGIVASCTAIYLMLSTPNKGATAWQPAGSREGVYSLNILLVTCCKANGLHGKARSDNYVHRKGIWSSRVTYRTTVTFLFWRWRAELWPASSHQCRISLTQFFCFFLTSYCCTTVIPPSQQPHSRNKSSFDSQHFCGGIFWPFDKCNANNRSY